MIDRIASLLKMQKPLLNRGLLFASGLTVPPNGSDGYQTGCIFQHTDGDAGEVVYVNNGSVTDSLFDNPEGGDTLTLAELADVADGFETRIVETGTYASTADSGVVLSATNKRPVAWLFDDGGAALPIGDYRANLSRVLLSIDQPNASTINAVRGQIKANNLIDITSNSAITAPVQGYLEFDGTGARTLNGHVACVRAALEEGASGTTTIGKYLAGFEATLHSTRTYAGAGLSAAFVAGIDGGTSKWQYGLFIEDDSCLVGITVGSAATGLDFTGTYTGNVIDLSNATVDHTGSGGPCLIRAGTYAAPVTNADEDQSGMIRLYSETSANGSSYDRGIFVCCKTTGLKNIFPIAGLAEVLAQSGAGPDDVCAGQFISDLHTSTSKLASGGFGMFGTWNKITSVTGSATAGSTVAAPVWVDNQMHGTVSGEEYGLFCTTGGTRPNGLIGLETTSSGYDQFIYADSTFDSGAGTCIETASVPGTQDARIRVWYDGLQYYIPLNR